MIRTLRIALIIVLSAAVSSFAAPKSKAKKAQTFPEFCEEILGALQAFYPVNATSMGIHTNDIKLTDYSTQSVKAMVGRLKQYERRLFKLEKTPMPDQDPIDLKLIKSNVDVALLNLDQIAWYKKSPQLYVDEAINGIYYLMLARHVGSEGKVPLVIARMKAVPALFTTARQNIKKPPSVWIQTARESLNNGIEFFQGIAADLARQFPSRAGEINQAANTARVSMNDFVVWLSELAQGDDKSFAIGKAAFDYKLKNEYFISYDADSLLKLGESLLARAQVAFDDYEKVVEAQHQTGQDSVFVPKSFTRQDILDYYQWETNQVGTFLKMNDIITVPDDIAEIKVVETPTFMRAVIRGIAYEPAGPFDTQQQGLFYVRPLPDSMDRQQIEARYRYVHRRGFKGSVVHEAYPGHHLQMQMAARNADPVRKWQMNTMMIEGWALYCEEMMYGTGLFGQEDPRQWLGVLGGIRFRAARIVADVKLHTGQFTYDECVDWMTKALKVETEADEQYIRSEVRRYTYTPTVQMSYLMGKREIELLKEASMKREGSNFTERGFYDKLLAEGSIPPALMWQALGLTPGADAAKN